MCQEMFDCQTLNLDNLNDEQFEDTNPWPDMPYFCGMCLKDVPTKDDLVESPCTHQPELLKEVPFGQYHCPECGMMVVAGMPHSTICKECAESFTA